MSEHTNMKTIEYVKLHASAEWTKDILRRIKEIADKPNVSEDDLEAIRWLVKQGLK